MNWYETAFGIHYGWLYAHRDRAEAADCVATLADHIDLTSGPVLDLGCGEGRHLPLLVESSPAGVVGLDLSIGLLNSARARSGTTQGLVRADMRTLPFADGCFSAVLSLFTAFGYFGGLSEHANLLTEISRILRHDGIWCLDYLNCRRVRRDMGGSSAPFERVVGPCMVKETKSLSEDGDRVCKRVEISPRTGCEVEARTLGIPVSGLDYTEAVALFEPDALDALALTAGMRRCGAVGGYDGRAFDTDTANRWILFYRRDHA